MIAIFSTTEVKRKGLLETAQAEGYTVLVASTRDKLSQFDAHWVEKVGKDNVFLAEAVNPEIHQEQQADPALAGFNSHRNAAISAGWLRLYAHLGEAWPTWSYTNKRGVKHTEAEFWTSARRHLQALGYRLGSSFKK